MGKVVTRSLSSALAACAMAALLVPAPAFAEEYKIGVMHVERILRQSAQAKAAADRIEQEFKARDADIARKEQEVRDAASQLEKSAATLAAEDRATRERALESRTRDVQRLRQLFAEDLRTRQFEELDKLKERLDRVLTRYAKERNFDLILQDALFVGKAVDITDDVIKALESASGEELSRSQSAIESRGRRRSPGDRSGRLFHASASGEPPPVDRIRGIAVPGCRRMTGPHQRVDERLVLGAPRRSDRGHVVLPLRERARAGDHRRHDSVRPQPCERELHRRAPGLRRVRLQLSARSRTILRGTPSA